MLNSKTPEKSSGVLLFAFNTKDIDYVQIANQSSRLITRNLGLPITLITDGNGTPSNIYDHVIFIDTPPSNMRSSRQFGRSEWINRDRCLAYELSPYHKTILLDSDYLVFDDSLLKLLEQDFDYRIMKEQIAYSNDESQLMESPLSLQFAWATVVVFSKSNKAKALFDLVGKIQRNYQYYKALFNARGSCYRNDYAFSMANTIINGYSINQTTFIPWKMTTVVDRVINIDVADSLLKIRTETKGLVIPKQNVHIMDKKYLQGEQFRKLTNEA